MNSQLQVLIVATDDAVVRALETALQDGDLTAHCHRVGDAQEMQEALLGGSWDVVLSELDAADFGAAEAVELLAENGRDIPLIAIPDRAVLIDFDDNRLNVLDNALPVMKELGLVGTMFVIAQLAESTDLGEMSGTYPEMHWDHLKILVAEGWLVGNHTLTHALLGELWEEEDGPARCEREIEGGREEIDARLEQLTKYFAYPRGCWNREVERLVKRSHLNARDWHLFEKPEYNTPDTDPYRIAVNNVSAHMSLDVFRSIVDGAL